MDDLARAALAHVDRRQLIDLASALIRIPSFKPDETAVARFLAEFFGERGYTVDLQEIEAGRFQTIATLPGTGGGASLMLNGHTDINALTRRRPARCPPAARPSRRGMPADRGTPDDGVEVAGVGRASRAEL